MKVSRGRVEGLIHTPSFSCVHIRFPILAGPLPCAHSNAATPLPGHTPATSPPLGGTGTPGSARTPLCSHPALPPPRSAPTLLCSHPAHSLPPCSARTPLCSHPALAPIPRQVRPLSVRLCRGHSLLSAQSCSVVHLKASLLIFYFNCTCLECVSFNKGKRS